MAANLRHRCRPSRHRPSLDLGLVGVIFGITSILANGCAPAPARTAPDDAAAREPTPMFTVESVGRGRTLSEARQSAILAGMRQAVGEFVDATTLVIDDEVTFERIESFLRSGQVRSATLGDPVTVREGVEVRMRIWVAPSAIADSVEVFRHADAAPLDGAAIADEIRVSTASRTRQSDLAERLIADTDARLLTASFVQRDGTTSDHLTRGEVRKHASGASIHLEVEVGFDTGSWEREVEPRMREFLEASASRVVQDGIRFTSVPGPNDEDLITVQERDLPSGSFGLDWDWVAIPRASGPPLINFDAYLVPTWLARSIEQQVNASELHLVLTCVDREGKVLDRTRIRFDGGRWIAGFGLEWQWHKTVGSRSPRSERRTIPLAASIYFLSRSCGRIIPDVTVVAPWWWLRDPRGLRAGILPTLRLPITLEFGLPDLDRLGSIHVHVH